MQSAQERDAAIVQGQEALQGMNSESQWIKINSGFYLNEPPDDILGLLVGEQVVYTPRMIWIGCFVVMRQKYILNNTFYTTFLYRNIDKHH